ncbi:MAG: hypothetical protein ABEJ99_00145 [Candidatus Nanohaloarchaea archaeon]
MPEKILEPDSEQDLDEIFKDVQRHEAGFNREDGKLVYYGPVFYAEIDSDKAYYRRKEGRTTPKDVRAWGYMEGPLKKKGYSEKG